MRLPVSKVYRALSELDKFDDERCAAFVATARRGSSVVGVLITLAMVACYFPGTCLGGALMIAMTNVLFGPIYDFDWRGVIGVVFLALGVAAPCMAGLLLRDVWLRHAIRKQLQTSRCPACRYSLLRLRPVAGHVTCPECGKAHDLAAMGLTEQDILAPEQQSMPA